MSLGGIVKKYFLGITLILLLILTTGCKKSIVGKWKAIESDSEYYYIFNKDKTCSYEMKVARLGCTYEEDDGKISILYKGNDKPTTFEYYFDDDTLVIKDSANKEYKFNKE